MRRNDGEEGTNAGHKKEKLITGFMEREKISDLKN